MPELESPYATLRAPIFDLYYETISRYPPPYAPGAEPAGEPPYRLGEYLVYQGYLSVRELRLALRESQGLAGAKPAPLGIILVTRYSVPVRVLAMTLLLQTLDHLLHAPQQPPRFLGEQLLRKRAITPEQLALVLEEQVSSYTRGTWNRIGDLIARRGWLAAEALSAMVHEMSGAPLPDPHMSVHISAPDPEQEYATIMAILGNPTQALPQAVTS